MFSSLRRFVDELADFYERDARFDISSNQHVRAAGTMRWALALRPNAPRYLALASITLANGEIHAARKAIAAAEKIYGETAPFELAFNCGVIESMCGNTKRAVKAMRRALLLEPDNRHAIYALGSLLASEGNIDEADRFFARDVSVMTGTGESTQTKALRFHIPAVRGEPLRRSVRLNPRSPCPTGEWRAVFFAAADSTYFCRYATPLAGSVKRSGAVDILLHFHLINPTAEALKTAALVSTRFPNIHISSEKVDLDGFCDRQRRAYYSCSRYLVLPEILSGYSVPVVVTDIDQMLMADPHPLISKATHADISLLRFDDQQHNLFSLVSATLTLFAPTTNAKTFASKLASRVEAVTRDPSNLVWHLDQAILAITYLGNRNYRYGFIPATMVHLSHKEPQPNRPYSEGIFWSITHSIPSNLTKLEMKAFINLEDV